MDDSATFAIDEVFGIIDSSATGRIDAENLISMLQRAGVTVSRKALNELLASNFGSIALTPSSFRRIMNQPLTMGAEDDKEATDLLWAFKQIAIDGGDKIRVATLKHYLKLFKLDLSEAQLERIFAGLHIEADGTIEYREVINQVLSNRSYFKKT